MLKKCIYVIAIIVISCLFTCSDLKDEDPNYLSFLDQLKAEESYIGFFETEEKLISELTPKYLQERKKCFLGIKQSKEEPFDYVEEFISFCLESELLKEQDEEEWEKVLTIISYEFYTNMPIFEYKTDQTIAHRSIAYAKYPNKTLELDLFIPKQPLDKPMPAVVCVHGGGWVVNRRIWFEPFAQYLAANGIAAVTIDYRKLPAVELIDCVFDAKAAVRWMRANATNYGIDSSRIGAIGASAGAHIVALLGTTADVPKLEGTGGNPNISSAVHAVVGIATPGFTPNTSKELSEILGIELDDYQLLSPYENISKDDASIFLIHGTVDDVVPPNNSQELYDKFQEVGVHAELKWIPNEGHGFYEGTDVAIKMATEFFKKQFETEE